MFLASLIKTELCCMKMLECVEEDTSGRENQCLPWTIIIIIIPLAMKE